MFRFCEKYLFVTHLFMNFQGYRATVLRLATAAAKQGSEGSPRRLLHLSKSLAKLGNQGPNSIRKFWLQFWIENGFILILMHVFTYYPYLNIILV